MIYILFCLLLFLKIFPFFFLIFLFINFLKIYIFLATCACLIQLCYLIEMTEKKKDIFKKKKKFKSHKTFPDEDSIVLILLGSRNERLLLKFVKTQVSSTR